MHWWNNVDSTRRVRNGYSEVGNEERSKYSRSEGGESGSFGEGVYEWST